MNFLWTSSVYSNRRLIRILDTCLPFLDICKCFSVSPKYIIFIFHFIHYYINSSYTKTHFYHTIVFLTFIIITIGITPLHSQCFKCIFGRFLILTEYVGRIIKPLSPPRIKLSPLLCSTTLSHTVQQHRSACAVQPGAKCTLVLKVRCFTAQLRFHEKPKATRSQCGGSDLVSTLLDRYMSRN